MSSKNNVNPDHYKVAGRDRPNDDLLQNVQKQQFAEAEARRKRTAAAALGDREQQPAAQTTGQQSDDADRGGNRQDTE
jgi:hypothetical protein